MIGNRFQLHNKINSGSFGQIHLAKDIKTKTTVAVKMQQITSKHPQLQYEAKLLAYLIDDINPRQYGLPRLHYYGKNDKFHIMVMDLLGPSLEQLFQKCNKKFTLKTVVMIGIQIIDRLKFLHQKKFIHRDIKPQNFLLGMHEHCDKIFMIDLGLSKKYVQKNGQHIPYRDDKSLKGTPRYTSINSHLGIQQSRRDDLQSVIYMLIYFLKGQLPWQNLKENTNYNRYQMILQKKLSVSVQNLCSGIPKQFNTLVQYTRNLHFIEEPNYQYMQKLLQQTLKITGQKLSTNDLYCWQQIQNQGIPKKQSFTKQFVKEAQNQKEFKGFSPFDSDLHEIEKDFQKPQKKNESIGFKPFDSNFKKRKDSRNSGGDPFAATKTERSQEENNFFDNDFGGFEMDVKHQVQKNDSFDNPFGDFKQPQPDIQQL